MTGPYRPQPRWLALGPLVGALSGSVVAFGVLVGGTLSGGTSSATDVLASLGPMLALAVVLGGLSGAVVGTVCGIALAVLVGRHLPRTTARRRSLVLGALLPPLVLVGTASVLAGEVLRAPVPVLLATAALGGLLAARAEARLLPHDGVS